MMSNDLSTGRSASGFEWTKIWGGGDVQVADDLMIWWFDWLHLDWIELNWMDRSGWLVGWLVDWLIDWLIDWLMDGWIDWLVDSLINWRRGSTSIGHGRQQVQVWIQRNMQPELSNSVSGNATLMAATPSFPQHHWGVKQISFYQSIQFKSNPIQSLKSITPLKLANHIPPKTNMAMEHPPFESMYFLLNIVIFHHHVSFQEQRRSNQVQKKKTSLTTNMFTHENRPFAGSLEIPSP